MTPDESYRKMGIETEHILWDNIGDLQHTVEKMFESILRKNIWNIKKNGKWLISFRDIIRKTLKDMHHIYIGNLFSTKERDNKFYVCYSDVDILEIYFADEDIVIEPKKHADGVETTELGLDSDEILSTLEFMFDQVLAANSWSTTKHSTQSCFHINARAAPPHRMDNPKIAALDIEIKRSKNKLKYMEAQLFPNGVPKSLPLDKST